VVYFVVLAPSDDDDDSRRDDNPRKNGRKLNGEEGEDDSDDEDHKKNHHRGGRKKTSEGQDSNTRNSPPGLTPSEVRRELGEFYIEAGAYDMATRVTSDDPAIQAANLKHQRDEIERDSYDTKVLNYYHLNVPGNERYDNDPLLREQQRIYLGEMMARNGAVMARKEAERRRAEMREHRWAEHERRQRGGH